MLQEDACGLDAAKAAPARRAAHERGRSESVAPLCFSLRYKLQSKAVEIYRLPEIVFISRCDSCLSPLNIFRAQAVAGVTDSRRSGLSKAASRGRTRLVLQHMEAVGWTAGGFERPAFRAAAVPTPSPP